MPAPIDSERSEELTSEKTVVNTWAAERASATPEAHEVQEVSSSDLTRGDYEARAADTIEELLAVPEPTFDMYVRTARDQCLTLSFTHGEAAACDLEELRRRITERAGGAPVGGFRLLHDGVDVETRSLCSFLIPGARLEQRVRVHGGGGEQDAAEQNKARKRAGGSLMGILGADWEKFAKMMAKRSAKNRALARSPKTPEDSIADSGTSDWTGMTEQGYGMFHKLTGPGKRAQPLASSNRQNENVPAATKPRTTAPSAAAAPRKKAPPRVNLPDCQKNFTCAVCFKQFGFKGDTNGPVDFFGKHVKRCCGGVGTNPKGHDEVLMRAILPKGPLTNTEGKRQYGWCVCFNSGECNGPAKLEGWAQDPNAQAAQPAAFKRAFDQLERNKQAASATNPSKKKPAEAPAPTAPEEPEVVGQQEVQDESFKDLQIYEDDDLAPPHCKKCWDVSPYCNGGACQSVTSSPDANVSGDEEIGQLLESARAASLSLPPPEDLCNPNDLLQ